MIIRNAINGDIPQIEMQFMINETIREEQTLDKNLRKNTNIKYLDNMKSLSLKYEVFNNILNFIKENFNQEVELELHENKTSLNFLANLFPLIRETNWYQMKQLNIY